MKKLIGFLVALCMVIGMLPVLAVASPPDGWTTVDHAKIKVGGKTGLVNKGTNEVAVWVNDANGVVTLLDADAATTALANGNWNAKLEYVGEMPTLTLKNATIGKFDGTNFSIDKTHGIEACVESIGGGKINLTIVLQGTNSIAAVYGAICGQGEVGELTIKGSQGASLTAFNQGSYNNIYGMKSLVFDNAKVTVDASKTSSGYRGHIVADNIIIKDSDLNVVGNRYSFAEGAIQCPDGTVTIINSKVKISAKLCRAISAKKLIVSGNSDLDLSAESGLCVVYASEELTVTDSTLKVFHGLSADTDADRDAISVSTGTVTFKNSKVTIERTTQESSYICNGINISDAGKLVVDGGSLTVKTDISDGSYGLYLEAGASAVIKGNATVSVNGTVYIADDNSLVLESGNATFTGLDYAVEGVMAIKGGSVTAIANKPQPDGAKPMDSAPTVNYAGEYHMLLGKAVDGSDAEAVTAAADAAKAGFRYFRLASGKAPSADDSGKVDTTEATTGATNSASVPTDTSAGVTTNGSPQTGDNAKLILAVSMALLSVLGIAVLIYEKKTAIK